MGTNWSNNGLVQFYKPSLEAGTMGVRPSADGVVLHLNAEGLHYGHGSFRKKWYFEWSASEITEVEVMGGESRLTVTRLATLGLLGAGLKKNRTWIRFATATNEAVFQVRVSADQARAWLGQFPWTRNSGGVAGDGGPNGVQGGLASQLRELTDLHAAGSLSDAQFEAAKNSLLGQG